MTPGGPHESARLPMFPLGAPLLPSMLLPLHVFEPRYRVMLEHVLDGDETFGVTMIERGSEVGGGDVRTSVGCRARVLEAEQQPDGRWHLLALGIDRIRVEAWLPDDPYPQAIVAPFPDTILDDDARCVVDPDRGAGLLAAFGALMALVERVSGGRVTPRVELADDQGMATFQMASVAPIGPLDRYRILCGEHAGVRRELLLDAFEHATVLVNDATNN